MIMYISSCPVPPTSGPQPPPAPPPPPLPPRLALLADLVALQLEATLPSFTLSYFDDSNPLPSSPTSDGGGEAAAALISDIAR